MMAEPACKNLVNAITRTCRAMKSKTLLGRPAWPRAINVCCAGQVSSDETERLIKMEETLHQRVVGQEEAVVAISRAIRRARVGLKNPNRPIASFIFSGPTGVGKSELAKTLASYYFGSQDAMVRLDMSEFMERHTVSKLIGSPPGTPPPHHPPVCGPISVGVIVPDNSALVASTPIRGLPQHRSAPLSLPQLPAASHQAAVAEIVHMLVGQCAQRLYRLDLGLSKAMGLLSRAAGCRLCGLQRGRPADRGGAAAAVHGGAV